MTEIAESVVAIVFSQRVSMNLQPKYSLHILTKIPDRKMIICLFTGIKVLQYQRKMLQYSDISIDLNILQVSCSISEYVINIASFLS